MENPANGVHIRNKIAGVVLLAAMAPATASAQGATSFASLADLSLEQLSNLQVTSVSGRGEPLKTAAASVFVITSEDIRRSAATSLPEVLRLAPNLQVAQSSGGSYAISARGFNNEIANKLLVLIDGRTLYSNLLSSVFWDANAVMLEDVERIEVISGPGGTIWGANAVNGVINVITRDAASTQGTLAAVTRSSKGGREAVRFGGTLGESGHFRIYGLTTDTDSTRLANGAERADDSRRDQAGFRADLQVGSSKLTLQGDMYRAGEYPSTGLKPKLSGGNLLARWSGHFQDGSPYQVQGYYDTASRDETTTLRNTSRNLSVDFTHEPVMPVGQHLLWGGGYRRGEDLNDPSVQVLFNPPNRGLSWTNFFVQHQSQLGDKWQLTAGVKAERNSYTGTELLPSARLAYQHSAESMTWTALSRAVRAPSRIDRDFFFPGKAPFLIVGGPNFQSEIANVMELGHRGQIASSFTYSGTLFRQYYKGLRAGIQGQLPVTVENQIEGSGQGLEAWAQWQATPDWRLSGGYFGLRKDLRFSSGATDVNSIPNLGNDPRYQWTFRSSHNLGARTELDFLVRSVGELPSPVVPRYTSLDARLAFRVSPALELSLLAQNLFDRRHVEFNAAGVASQIERRIFLRAVWKL
ncbi:MAG: TonB-dependent receptor [Pseudomonadota bacterium]